jgi:ankyrin repeat protein
MTFVYWAVLNKSRSGLTYLLHHKAVLDGIVKSTDTSSSTLPGFLEGTSPISLAAKLDDPWFLKNLAENGADINLINPLNGRTPLVEALANRRDENVRYLISRGANLNTVDKLGMTPLAEAVANQRFDISYALLEAGADPTVPIAKNGATMLTVLRHTAIPNRPPQSEWRQKFIVQLQQKGLDVAGGQ